MGTLLGILLHHLHYMILPVKVCLSVCLFVCLLGGELFIELNIAISIPIVPVESFFSS